MKVNGPAMHGPIGPFHSWEWDHWPPSGHAVHVTALYLFDCRSSHLLLCAVIFAHLRSDFSSPPSPRRRAAQIRVAGMEPESEFFRCPTCAEQVPVQNRILHSLACERRQRLSSQPMKPTSDNPILHEQTHDDTEDGVVFSAPGKREQQRPLSSTDNHQIPTLPSMDTERVPTVCSNPPTSSSTTPTQPVIRLPCSFCHLDLPAVEHGNHETRCGTRTDVCAACSRRVRKRDWPLHMDSACQFGATTTVASDPRHESDPLLARDDPDALSTSWSPAAVVAAVVAAGAAAAIGASAFRRRRR